MALLEIDRVAISIADRTIVEDLSFTLARGETLGLVGESGSGKSMTALAIMQLLPRAANQRGEIRFDGRTLSARSEAQLCAVRGRDIGMVFQEPMTALNPLMSIGDQVAETVLVHGVAGRKKARLMAHAALARVGLAPPGISPARFPHELSGGQRQRAAIAMAVVLSPKLLIADEPTTALDTVTQAEILGLLKQLIGDNGTSLLLISHDLALVAHMTDRLAVLKAGRCIELGATPVLLEAGAHDYTRSLVAASRLSKLRRAGLPQPHPAGEVPLLEARGVVCDYGGVRAVDDVSLTLSAGECVGIVGESGSGKSTLLRAILAVRPIQAGQIRLDGESVFLARAGRLRRLRRMMQCVFQDPAGSFDPRWRVERLIAEPLHLLDSPLAPLERRSKIEGLLERVGLRATDADRFAWEFSGGQRQRIAIARALIVNPRLLALDEAVSALDVTTRAQILALLAELSDSMGLALVLVSHDLAVVRCITDRVVVLKQGRVVETGNTAEVFDAPRHPYTASLVGAALTI